ncbi:CPBP family intramembrane glutamic endopeptidase [Chitinophaga nivalis]|uniref:CPBP family intramembrane metalloprotease n=1 Tax=Chitinophaga nivalis TaxID=2991709 RepID=A0ABT3INU7_9BACT|nr:CPBP family intramembrane glutamic endopeptidase [Chitinophaga nivalis]MCW3464738.1 CPBP family intramembrane metalloprotease [Chitinophaga nivalis]MCW3485571.1 CPBP family intramembrane metalloprotease [Chitinophaga nivalis]
MLFDLQLLPGYLLFIVSILLCFFRMVKAGWIILAIAYVLAFINGGISITGVAFLLTEVILLLLAVRYSSGWQRTTTHIAFFLLSVLLLTHQLPGFSNVLIFDRVRFTPDAAPFTMHFNLDKPFAGFAIFTCLLKLGYVEKYDIRKIGKAIIIPLAAIIAICILTAWALHFVAWEPKLLLHYLWIWALHNLLIVAVTEETVFRGYLQGYAGSNVFGKQPYYLSLMISALLFALVHTTGGWPLMLLAFIAGLGYGVAYHKAGIMAAIFTHFGFNLLHFLLFTYPMLGKS